MNIYEFIKIIRVYMINEKRRHTNIFYLIFYSHIIVL